MIDRTAYPDPNSYAAARRIVRDDIALRMLAALVEADWFSRYSATRLTNLAYDLANAYLAKVEEDHAK